ncbi:hypothetical protein AAG906_000162 [Vitis piasezkii]
MKIQCSFCSKEEASVFCTADEAPLCDICDRQVHHANKLAGKHKRYSLLRPSDKDFPSCDLCQDKRAFLFCKEDRAILCRECDVSIHKANEHTRKHYRFLLTGVKLSTSASEYPISASSSSPSTIDSETKPAKSSTKRPTSVSADIFCNTAIGAEIKPSKTSTKRLTSVSAGISNPTVKTAPAAPSYKRDHDNQSISEYLMETLPGWRVDDFLDPSSGFSEFPDHGVGTHLSSFPYEDFAVWVPQDTPQFNHLPLYIPQTGGGNGLKASEEANTVKVSRKRIDDGFTVPEISTLPLKKSRNLW